MSADPTPQWSSEPPPQNRIEKLIRRLGKSDDHSHMGELFRLLEESPIFFPLPYHPEIVGDWEIGNGDTMTISAFADAEGPFYPAFTSDAVAEWSSEYFPGPGPWAIGSTPGRIWFGVVAQTGVRVVINPRCTARLLLKPELVEDLARGCYSGDATESGDREKMQLLPIRPDAMPGRLLREIRTFCARRRDAIAVYAFHPISVATQQAEEGEIRIIVWLRDQCSRNFQADLGIVVERAAPPRIEIRIGFMNTGEDEGSMAFLQRCEPIWPISKGQ